MFILASLREAREELKAGALGLELWQSPWRDAAFWPPHSHSATLFNPGLPARDHTAWGRSSISSQLRKCSTDQSDGGSPSAGAPPLRHSSCVELTETNQQSYKVVSPLSEIDPI